MNDITKYETTEMKFIKQFGGERVTDLQQQYKDIDVIRNNKTVSIKDQLFSSNKYGNITLETKLKTLDGKEMKGCFEVCEADYYGWLISHPVHKVPCWLVCSVQDLKDFVKSNNVPTFSTRPETIQHNINQKRKFVYGEGFKLSIASLLNNDKFKFIKVEE